MLHQQTFSEAGGALSGKIDNAAFGLTIQKDPSGAPWAWDPASGQWVKVHVLKSGQNLWNLAGSYYGTNSRWTEIKNYPRNLPIVGSTGDKAFAGDTIVIPNLPQPFPKPGATQVLELPAAPPTTPPAGWPASVPYPGQAPPAAPPSVPVTYEPASSPAPAQGAAAGAAAGVGETPKPFWTTGRIVVAAGAGAVGLGLIVYLATRKRRNPRRRRHYSKG